MPDSRKHVARARIVCALWLLVGFTGATALTAGMLRLFDGGPGWALSAALAACGAVLAFGSWRHALIVLEGRASPSRIATNPSEARS